MASKKVLHEGIRSQYMALVEKFLADTCGDEVLRTASNEFAIPCVDAEGNDEFLVLTFKVPTGSRDGDAYDGYAVKQEYDMKVAAAAVKAKKAAEAKAAKIAKDRKMREQKAAAKAERERV